MSVTLNMRAKAFALRELFLAEPDEGFSNASLSVRDLAFAFCSTRDHRVDRSEETVSCRKHAQAMVLGVSKMVVAGEVFAELSAHGVIYVRLSPAGVLSPLSWSSVPPWFDQRPELVEWARNDELRRKWEARV